MTKHLIETTLRQLRTVAATSVPVEDDEDKALLAHAAARILWSYKPTRYSLCGPHEMLTFVAQHFGLSTDKMVKNEESPTAQEWRVIAKRLASRPLPETDRYRRLAELCQILGLDATDLAILISFALMYRGLLMRELLRTAELSDHYLSVRTLGLISGLSVAELELRLASHGRLVGMGLISDDKDGDYRSGPILRGVVDLHGATRAEVERFIIPECEGTSLTWEDFAHLGPLRDLAEQILRADRPVSILLYGPPGTGKSEFARALARQVGRGASFAGLMGSADSEEPKREERLGHLTMLRRLCSTRSDRLVVVDEADDVLSLARERHASKQYVNRLIEDPKVPTVWIVNDPGNLDAASLRRMILAIRFEQPAQAVRQRIVMCAAETEGLPIKAEDTARLAAYPANAATLAAGVRAASLSGGHIAHAERAVESVLQAMGHHHRPEASLDACYKASLSNADTDLSVLADRLVAAPSRRWSLLLAGPSGTGKSIFARHLAERLGIEVDVRRGSDLLGPYVGQTEANIAAAFSRAESRRAMLVIDEADSFLFRREAGQRSWETSLVNEMLCQMEGFTMPFVATTNLLDRLDPATQRRFTLHIGFRAMTPQQAQALFVARFGMDWPAGEAWLASQTPGDFAVVAARADLLGERSPRQLIRWLREEAAMRGDGIKAPLGFCPPSAERFPEPRLIFREDAA